MTQKITFYQPSKEDGADVFQLISSCPPLDTNSMYCNLLQSHHFSATSVAARLSDELVGFVSGYLIPEKPNTLFIWQVAVAEKVRGQGVASKMIMHILDRKVCQSMEFIETSITKTNQGSWALFGRIAKNFNAPLTSEDMFTKDEHLGGQHETEILAIIGPLMRDKFDKT